MAKPLSVLCVHGVGHGDSDAALVPSWTNAITSNVQRWSPTREVQLDFLRYDDLFEHAPLNGAVYAKAMAKLFASGLVHGIGDLISSTRSFLDVPAAVQWTAGMIAQWASEGALREALRRRILAKLAATSYDLVCAHSLGSLLCYDTFRRNPSGLAATTLVTLGSQIGNPFVRDTFAGRIEALKVRRWYHLYNREDHVLTARVRLTVPSFVEVETDFDKPGDVLNHDAIYYFDHANTQATVWPYVGGGEVSRDLTRTFVHVRAAATRPRRRALLIAIDDYPDPANRLDGCANDAFLVSGLLQESGFRAEDIRVVANQRATAASLLERLHWLLDDVPPNAERVLFYSGHGAQIPSYGATGEVDHLDECLVPYDFDWSPEHAIRDKQFAELYTQLPYDTQFVAIFDCCHSGGLTREGGLRVRGLTPPDDIRHRVLAWRDGRWHRRDLEPTNGALPASYAGTDAATHRLGRSIALRQLPRRRCEEEREALRHKGPYLPIILEACGEQQLSYEHREGNVSYGAFTFAMAQTLRESHRADVSLTFRALARLTHARLRDLGYPQQTPQVVGPSARLAQKIPWAPAKPSKRRAK